MTGLKTSPLRQIVGRLKKIIMSNWFLTFGAMALPVGFTLITLATINKNIPITVYWLGWVSGIIGLVAFFVALRLAYSEIQERKATSNKSKEDIRSAMKSMGAIHRELKGMREDMKKWRPK